MNVIVQVKTAMRKGLWLKEEETEPGTRQPDGDRGLNILTVVLMERVLHWREANFTPGTNYFPEKKPRGHPRLMVQRSSYLTGILRVHTDVSSQDHRENTCRKSVS